MAKLALLEETRRQREEIAMRQAEKAERQAAQAAARKARSKSRSKVDSSKKRAKSNKRDRTEQLNELRDWIEEQMAIEDVKGEEEEPATLDSKPEKQV